jgi:hypothetical protein
VDAEHTADVTSGQVRRLGADHDLWFWNGPPVGRANRKVGRLDFLFQRGNFGKGDLCMGDKLVDTGQRDFR